MDYQSFKGRKIDFTRQVKIYKNLHNGLFSVMQDSIVVAHIESFIINCVIFKVNEKGRQRVIKDNRKNVHAFVCGILQSVNCGIQNDRLSPITYNPYKANCFYFRNDPDTDEILLHDFELVTGDNVKGLFLID